MKFPFEFLMAAIPVGALVEKFAEANAVYLRQIEILRENEQIVVPKNSHHNSS